MKKTVLFFLALLLMLGAGWTAASWYLGQETERVLRQQLDAAQHLYVSDSLALTLVEYHKSLFGARARTLLQFRKPPLDRRLGRLPLIHDIRHGPLLFDDRLYMMVSETEMDHGYIDLSLIVRPDMRRFQALDLLLEFKYVSLKDLKLTGEAVRGQSRDALMTLPPIQEQLQAAEAQARRYGAALQERYGLTDLRLYAVVGVGLERVVCHGTVAVGALGRSSGCL